MRAFIIRPFGKKNRIDFDAVEEKLIAPALEKLGISGRTTLEILRPGNIRVDMFQRLLTADLVIADVSIHNANLFYELGIRHALRDKHTVMIRCSADSYPFDLQTDRYFTYDKKNPANSFNMLVEVLKKAIDSKVKDSPVFELLPDLQIQDRSRFLAVPIDFSMELSLAIAGKHPGDLELLAREIKGFEWEMVGLRLIGRGQFDLKANQAAKKTWESVRKSDLNDWESNRLLATIYQRLGDLASSDAALDLVLKRKDLTDSQRAEARALLGSNAKTRWKDEWFDAQEDKRQVLALQSPSLTKAYEEYRAAYLRDLNHFYSGLNALALLTILTELAAILPDVWQSQFAEHEDPTRELESKVQQRAKLASSVGFSIAGAKNRNLSEGKEDIWLNITEADAQFLTTQKPDAISFAYKKALNGASDFHVDAARRQVIIYDRLGILKEKTKSALSVLPGTSSDEAKPKEKTSPGTVLLFTGHMIDQPRDSRRFPAGDKFEKIARTQMKDAIQNESKAFLGRVKFGIAGGANGGDILFHEICRDDDMKIATRLFLALPKEKFISKSVSPAGPNWVARFNTLYEELPVRVLQDSEDLPVWLREKPDYNIWERNNLWMLHNALAEGANVTLIALWNEKSGKGPGGTGHLVKEAESRGVKVIKINPDDIFPK